MTVAVEQRRFERAPVAAAPMLCLGAALVAAALLLSVPLRVPAGTMYWDVAVYLEAAQRIFQGQLPNVDFSGPVGPLGYFLFALGLRVFPEAQPVLLAQWSMLLVTAPAFALVLRDVLERSRSQAWALLVPFLLFSLLPLNTLEFSFYPGIDGFGTYNRQTSQLLYVLAAALLFVRDRGRLTLVLAILVPALFLTKITGFAAAGLVLAFAFGAGRIPLATALTVGGVFFAVLLALEMTTGIVEAYLADIAFLLADNSGTLLPRIVSTVAQNLDVIGPTGLLVAVLIGAGLAAWRDPRLPGAAPDPGRLARLLDRDWLWLGVLLGAATLFETQNTGSQSFLMVWPALYAIAAGAPFPSGRLRIAVVALAAFAAIPTASGMVHRALRTLAAVPLNAPVAAGHLGGLGRISVKPLFFEGAERRRRDAVEHPGDPLLASAMADTASYRPFAEHDFQLLWLQSVDEAAAAILALEAQTGRRFETIFAADFVNPLPWALNRDAPRFLPLGAVPGRTAKPLDERMRASLAAADLVLVPRCTASLLSQGLLELYGPALSSRRAVALTPCWDALLRDTPASG